MNVFDDSLLNKFSDQKGITILEYSSAAPMLLVLIRRVGCSFCRRTLQELKMSLPYIKTRGYSVGIVHMNTDLQASSQLARYGLDYLPRFQDAKRELYKGLGLNRAPLSSLFKAEVIRQGVRTAREHGTTFPEVDPFQLPGAFLIDHGQVIAGNSVLSPNENPDFLSLVTRRKAPAESELVLS